MKYQPIGAKPAGDPAPALAYTLGGPADPAPAVVRAVLAEAGGKTVLTLAHEYAGLNPQPGWVARRRGVELTVLAVTGRVLEVA